MEALVEALEPGGEGDLVGVAAADAAVATPGGGGRALPEPGCLVREPLNAHPDQVHVADKLESGVVGLLDPDPVFHGRVIAIELDLGRVRQVEVPRHPGDGAWL